MAAVKGVLRVDLPMGLMVTTHSNFSLSSSETVSGSDVRTRWTYRSLMRWAWRRTALRNETRAIIIGPFLYEGVAFIHVGKVMVKAVEGVSDKGARRDGKHLFGVGLVEDDGSLYVPAKFWRTQDISAECEYHPP